jgi:hypothetical protein
MEKDDPSNGIVLFICVASSWLPLTASVLVAERSPAATLVNCTVALASVPPSATLISYRMAAADELMNRKGELLFTRIKTYSIRMERGN